MWFSPDYLVQAEQLSKIAAVQFHDPHIGSAQLMSAQHFATPQDALNRTHQRSSRNGHAAVQDNVLIMIDSQGSLASSNNKERLEAIDNHKRWIDFSYKLGCETMRVNLSGEDNLEKWTENSVKSLSVLSNYNKDLNVVVENHGGLSSNGKYLANVMSKVNIDNCGTLPDFGNFCIDGSPRLCAKWYDIYKGVKELMPYAHAVSAKSYHFDDNGHETSIDYSKMIDIVKDAGYKGYIGIEFEGNRLSEDEGIIATKKLLEKLI